MLAQLLISIVVQGQLAPANNALISSALFDEYCIIICNATLSKHIPIDQHFKQKVIANHLRRIRIISVIHTQSGATPADKLINTFLSNDAADIHNLMNEIKALDFIDHISAGLIHLHGPFAIKFRCVKQSILNNANMESKYDLLCAEVISNVCSEVTKEISGGTHFTKDNLMLLLEKYVKKGVMSLNERLAIELGPEKMRIFNDLPIRCSMPNGNQESLLLRNRLIATIRDSVAKNNSHVPRQPLQVNSYLQFVSTQVVQVELKLDSNQLAAIPELSQQFSRDLTLLNATYQALPHKTFEEQHQAYVEINKLLSMAIRKYDKDLKTAIGPTAFNKLIQLKRAYAGPAFYFDGNQYLNKPDPYKITDQQKEKYRMHLATTLNKIKQLSSEIGIDAGGLITVERGAKRNRAIAECMFNLQNTILSEILTEDQRKHYFEVTGPRFTKTKFIDLFMELQISK